MTAIETVSDALRIAHDRCAALEGINNDDLVAMLDAADALSRRSLDTADGVEAAARSVCLATGLDYDSLEDSGPDDHLNNSSAETKGWFRYLARAALASRTPNTETVVKAEPAALDVEWVVNQIAELGVKIGDQFFFCYKGHSLTYTGENGSDVVLMENSDQPMHWRPVFKREFGECVHPINYKDLTKIGTVSLDDSDNWKPLPAAREVNAPLFLTSPPSPAEVTVTDAMVEAAARQMVRSKFMPRHAEDAVEARVEAEWQGWARDMRLALTAALDQHGKKG